MIKIDVCPSSKTATFTQPGVNEIDLEKAEKILEDQGFNILKKTKDLLVGMKIGSCAYTYKISVLRNGKILVKADEDKIKKLENLIEHIFKECG